MNKAIFLGYVEYMGEKSKAYREIYPNFWQFVIVNSQGRHTLLTY